MEALIGLLLIGLVLRFLGQMFNGVENIFSVVGRIGGWILGIILIGYILLSVLFG